MNNEGYETPPSSDDEMEVSDDDDDQEGADDYGAIGAIGGGGPIYVVEAYQSPPVAQWQQPLVPPGAPLRQQLPPWRDYSPPRRQSLFPPPPPMLYASPGPSSGHESKISPPHPPQLPRTAVAGRGLLFRPNNNEVEDEGEDEDDVEDEEEDEELPPPPRRLPGTPPRPDTPPSPDRDRRRGLEFGRRRRSRRREAASVEKYLNMYW